MKSNYESRVVRSAMPSTFHMLPHDHVRPLPACHNVADHRHLQFVVAMLTFLSASDATPFVTTRQAKPLQEIDMRKEVRKTLMRLHHHLPRGWLHPWPYRWTRSLRWRRNYPRQRVTSSHILCLRGRHSIMGEEKPESKDGFSKHIEDGV